jgi:hypothetical protein
LLSPAQCPFCQSLGDQLGFIVGHLSKHEKPRQCISKLSGIALLLTDELSDEMGLDKAMAKGKPWLCRFNPSFLQRRAGCL